jgi:hypothetical protein
MHNIIHKQKHLIRNLNNCFKNFQSLKSTNYIPCTIKPNYLSIPRDVNILDIVLLILPNPDICSELYKSSIVIETSICVGMPSSFQQHLSKINIYLS